MSVLFFSVVIITCCGLALLVWMFPRNDTRLGMIALAVLMAANLLAMVHAALNA